MVAPPDGPVLTVTSPCTSSDFRASRAVPLLTPNSACNSSSLGSLSPGPSRRSAIQRLISSTTRSPRLGVRSGRAAGTKLSDMLLFIMINRMESTIRPQGSPELDGHQRRAVARAVAPAARRQAGHPLEGAGEGGLGLIADVGGDAGDAVTAVAQALAGELDAPAGQVV